MHSSSSSKQKVCIKADSCKTLLWVQSIPLARAKPLMSRFPEVRPAWKQSRERITESPENVLLREQRPWWGKSAKKKKKKHSGDNQQGPCRRKLTLCRIQEKHLSAQGTCPVLGFVPQQSQREGQVLLQPPRRSFQHSAADSWWGPVISRHPQKGPVSPAGESHSHLQSHRFWNPRQDLKLDTKSEAVDWKHWIDCGWFWCEMEGHWLQKSMKSNCTNLQVDCQLFHFSQNYYLASSGWQQQPQPL